MEPEGNCRVIEAVEKASRGWRNAFNRGDAAGCAAAYEDDAVMEAKPFGVYRGRADIEAFWRQLIEDGFRDVSYIEPDISVVDESSAILSAKWTMNNAHGVISRELWVLQADGSARLREDAFEALG